MRKWKFVGSNFSVDFVNTIGGRTDVKNEISFTSTIRQDKLKNCNDIIDWATEIGIINQSESIKLKIVAKRTELAQEVFNRAKLFREALYRIFKHKIVGISPLNEDLDILNKELTKARINQNFVFLSGSFKWVFNKDQKGLDLILNKIAISASELLTNGKLEQLKQCRGADCGWLFIDQSKNHSRLWCDMKDCGNFEKVRRFREKGKLIINN